MFGSAVVEHLTTTAGARLCAWADGERMAVLPHYSPGYPEWDIAEQPRLFSLRGPRRRCRAPSRCSSRACCARRNRCSRVRPDAPHRAASVTCAISCRVRPARLRRASSGARRTLRPEASCAPLSPSAARQAQPFAYSHEPEGARALGGRTIVADHGRGQARSRRGFATKAPRAATWDSRWPSITM